jgi:N-acetylglucosamine kinase-like BadF-type ATPase
MLMKEYILGVDGGNTKTDYILMDTHKNFISRVKTGTCSHESVKNGFDGAKQAIDCQINQLLEPLGIERNQIVKAVFGLAGIDTTVQQAKLTEIIGELGFSDFIAINDSYLSLKSVSPDGTGVCSINGTGSTAGGIDSQLNKIQVGGIGAVTGDCGGGRYFSAQVIKAIYSELFRVGELTTMTKPMLELLSATKYTLMDIISEKYMARSVSDTAIMKILFEAVNAQDEVAKNIVLHAANELANSVLGCIRELKFESKINIITAGSIWVYCETPLLYNTFIDRIKADSSKIKANASYTFEFIMSKFPPVFGAVNWAFELYEGVDETMKRVELLNGIMNEAITQ